MNFIKNILSPVLVIITFLLIVISGEETGGFYFTYIKRALPHAALYAVLAAIGILLLLVSVLRSIGSKTHLISVLNQAGGLLLLLSLMIFFIADSTGYNLGTFSQAVPLITIITFLLVVGCFIYINIVSLMRRK